jgi:hypothetical protein
MSKVMFDIFYYDWCETHQDWSPQLEGDGQGNGFGYGDPISGDGLFEINCEEYEDECCYDFQLFEDN